MPEQEQNVSEARIAEIRAMVESEQGTGLGSFTGTLCRDLLARIDADAERIKALEAALGFRRKPKTEEELDDYRFDNDPDIK